MNRTDEGARFSSRAALCATAGLACMFGGIWLGDGCVLEAVDLPSSTMVMRVFTVLIYGCFLGISIWFAKRLDGDMRRFFGISVAISMTVFSLAVLFIIFVLLPGQVSVPAAVRWAVLAATKLIGAPLSIGLVCVFALLERTHVIQLCTWGMVGAFLIHALFVTLQSMGIVPASLNLVVSVVLLTVAGIVGRLGMLDMRDATGKRGPRAAAVSVPGVIRRPIARIVTPGFLLMALFSSLMLGFLRNGYQQSDPHMQPLAVIGLLGLIVVAVAWKGLRIEHLFYTAFFCVAIAALLSPMIETLLPGFTDPIYALGSAFFEVVVWALAVWAARNSIDTLLAAASTRTATTIGHFLGTVVVWVGLFLSPTLAEASRTGALFIVFIYVVLLVVVTKRPSLQAPFLTSVDALPVYAPSVPEQPDVSETTDQADSPPEEQAPVDTVEIEKRYWGDPCDTIAGTYRLTAREREVLEHLARGRNLAFMEEKLVLSPNTLKMHIRHIYTKLDVHSKQDVIDMVEALR